MKIDQNDTQKGKIFHTTQGYLLLYSPKNKSTQTQNSTTFDLADILLHATSLPQITTKIISAFTRDGEKKYSDDMAHYSFNYKNSSDMTAIISYQTSNDEVTQLFFLMPKEQAVEIGKKSFIKNFQQKQVDGNAIWVNSNSGLVYEAGQDGQVGIIVVSQH